jgi:hypothetical protein
MKNRNTERGGEAEGIQQGQMAFHGKGPGSCNDPAGDIEAGHGALRGASHLLCGREEPAGLAFSEFRGYERLAGRRYQPEPGAKARRCDPQAHDAKCGFSCHTLVKERDYVFTEYRKR